MATGSELPHAINAAKEIGSGVRVVLMLISLLDSTFKYSTRTYESL